MSEKKELNEKNLGKAAGGKSINIPDHNGFSYCPNPACGEAYLEKVNEGPYNSSGKKTNEFTDNCGDTYYLYECPVCHTRYRKYHSYEWTTD